MNQLYSKTRRRIWIYGDAYVLFECVHFSLLRDDFENETGEKFSFQCLESNDEDLCDAAVRFETRLFMAIEGLCLFWIVFRENVLGDVSVPPHVESGLGINRAAIQVSPHSPSRAPANEPLRCELPEIEKEGEERSDTSLLFYAWNVENYGFLLECERLTINGSRK
jgi:hypothetical protein